jgi:glutamate-5-semialdehyde dehydrogenase
MTRSSMNSTARLSSLVAGTQLLVDGDRVVTVPHEIAARFRAGDALYASPEGELLLVPRVERELATAKVTASLRAFDALRSASDASISRFFSTFAERLCDDSTWAQIARANESDAELALARGRSTTRLRVTEAMRAAMVEGLHGWRDADSRRHRVLECVRHEGWRAELVSAPLGVVAFAFEGRPNVVVDAAGVLRTGNTAVLRIGRDALRTAKEIIQLALRPALRDAGLPEDSVCLLDSEDHASAWALFADARVSLAVARGSGAAVLTLGSLARQAGIPVSLHGTGGAWLVASSTTDPGLLEQVVCASLDRKVCNTLNTLCIPRAHAAQLVGVALIALARAAEPRGRSFKLHVLQGSESAISPELFSRRIPVVRAHGVIDEPQAELLSEAELGREWEWEETPEITLVLVDSVDEAVSLFNQHSPRFVASLLSADPIEHEAFFTAIDAPFVGDAETRWVDGQKALRKPELGLSNWQLGRLFGRGGILCGDDVYTIRTRARREP